MTIPQPQLVTLSTGKPKVLGTLPDGSPFISSIARQPVSGPVQLSIGGFDDDACEYHGHHGLDLTVNVFADEDYPYFEELAGRTLPRPGFGENLTLRGYTDRDAIVGDVLRVGTALLQVSQPRVPCSTLVRFHHLPRIIRWMEDARRTGYYLRVLEPGVVSPDSPIQLVDRGTSGWSIFALEEVMYAKVIDQQLVDELQEVKDLAQNWKSSLIHRARRRQPSNMESTTAP